MSNEKYLTEELKVKYQRDIENIKNIEDEYWALDKDIREYIDAINSNQFIQTIYSKIYPKNNNIGKDPASYLEIAFKKEFNKKLNIILSEIKSNLISDDVEINISLEIPQDNPNYNPKSKVKIGCIIDSDYFRVFHYRIQLISNNTEIHETLFKLLANKLSNSY
jgi:hypothetical protein